MKIRTRIAPSPTGDPHVGTPYMALFNLVFARHYGGTFILRIEDTDQGRSRPHYEEAIYDSLRWLGISWDEGPDKGGGYGPYRQSERTAIYRRYCELLLNKGHAYKCFATPEELQEIREMRSPSGARGGYDRRYRNLSPEEIKRREEEGQAFVVRLKVPLTGSCIYEDLIRGTVSVPWSDVDDQILLKSDGMPTYHLANVVDDHLMEISHVIRGDEWMSSTPKHVLMYDLFGWERPQFMHMPLLLGADGRKLSKRKNPTAVSYYKACGYLPAAFVNFLTLMGYHMGGDREIYSLDEMVQDFSIERIGRAGAFFDVKKLDWVNQQYIIHSLQEPQKLWDAIRNWGFSDERMARIMPLIHTRIKHFGEFIALCSFFFVDRLPLQKEILCPRGMEEERCALLFQAMIWSMDGQEDWEGTGFAKASHEVALFLNLNHKKVVMPALFAAITGKQQGPPLFDSVTLLGRGMVRARLLDAIEALGYRRPEWKLAWEEWRLHHTA